MIDLSLNSLPDDLPVPIDNGEAAHLYGAYIPSIPLPSTLGTLIDISSLPGRGIIFFFPRTGQPDQPDLTPDWDRIPGARGCTPQICGFRDNYASFQAKNCYVFGVSTQDTEYQLEMAERLRLSYAVLSDAGLRLTHAMNLPIMTVCNQTLIRRMVWVVTNGQISHIFYPVFPPDKSAAEVLTWLNNT